MSLVQASSEYSVGVWGDGTILTVDVDLGKLIGADNQAPVSPTLSSVLSFSGGAGTYNPASAALVSGTVVSFTWNSGQAPNGAGYVNVRVGF